MGNIGIALGAGKAFSAPAWFILVIMFFALSGIKHLIAKRGEN